MFSRQAVTHQLRSYQSQMKERTLTAGPVLSWARRSPVKQRNRAGYAAQLVEFSSSAQETLGSGHSNPALKHRSASPALSGWRRKGQKFKVILSYKAKYRLAWATVPSFGQGGISDVLVRPFHPADRATCPHQNPASTSSPQGQPAEVRHIAYSQPRKVHPGPP